MLRLKSIVFATLLLCTMNIFGMNYGIMFHSHADSPELRTTLLINENRAIKAGDIICVSFNVLLRPESNQYGDFLEVKGNDGTEIRVMIPSYSTSPVLVINDSFFSGKRIDLDKEFTMTVAVDKKRSKISLLCDADTVVSAPWNLKKIEEVLVTFGQQAHRDVAPVDIRDIRIYVNGRQQFYWPLKEHNGDISLDSVHGVEAKAKNPSWIVDEHRRMKLRYSLSTSEQIQTAFDPETERLYIVGDSTVTTVSLADTVAAVQRSISRGFRVMRESNNLFYMPHGRLMSLNLGSRRIAWCDLESFRWDCDTFNDDGATYGGHTWAFENGVGYAFGGYGFHNYNNTMFIVDTVADSIMEVQLSPLPHPRNASSMAIVGNKLYIFGGHGNESGHQELPSRYYYDLYEYDLTTFAGEKLWEFDTVDYEFICTQTMIYEPDTDSFIIGTTRYGGQMIRISRTDPGFVDVTFPLALSMSMRDIVLQLFYSNHNGTYYFVIDRWMVDMSHELSVYSVKAPLEAIPAKKAVGDKLIGNRWHLPVIIVCSLLFLIIVAIVIMRRRRKCTFEHVESDLVASVASSDKEHSVFVSELPGSPTISLIGNFNVVGKFGEDITSRFSGKMRDLFVFMILMSKRSPKGVAVNDIDETIWKDMEPQPARNNRNVYIRRLRTVLQEVGDVSIVSDDKYYKIKFNGVSDDVDIAFGIMDAVSGSNGGYNPEEVWEKVRPYLMKGQLLANIRASWADSFKADFSQRCINFLSELIKSHNGYAMSKDVLLEIADAMFMHDELSEDALKLKCNVLCSRHMSSMAMTVYDNFCKSYFKYMGEKYLRTFQQICR